MSSCLGQKYFLSLKRGANLGQRGPSCAKDVLLPGEIPSNVDVSRFGVTVMTQIEYENSR